MTLLTWVKRFLQKLFRRTPPAAPPSRRDESAPPDSIYPLW